MSRTSSAEEHLGKMRRRMRELHTIYYATTSTVEEVEYAHRMFDELLYHYRDLKETIGRAG